MSKITADDIRQVNQTGIANPEAFWSYYTPVLQVAFELGQRGIDLAAAPVVSGMRYGIMPAGGISYNYRDERSERGLSLACIDGDKEVGSCIWFADRIEHNYTGVLLPYTGSDGEALILIIGIDNLDN